MIEPMRRAAGSCLATLAATAPALATTWVVDDNGGPGVDFVTIQDAVDAAVDGDVIEVRDGGYPGFTIDGEALVVRRTTGIVRVLGPVLVTNVDAPRRVELDGLRFDGIALAAPPVVVAQNAGSVRLVDCHVIGHGAGNYSCPAADAPQDALHAEGSDLTLLRCIVQGGWGASAYYCGWDGGTAVVATAQCMVTVLDSSLRGGTGCDGTNGWYGSTGYGGDGGDAVDVSGGSTLFCARTELFGAAAGFGTCGSGCAGAPCPLGLADCPDGAHGSAAVVGALSSMTWRQCAFQPEIPKAAVEVRFAPLCLGTHEECPCANHGAGVAGCEHAFGLGGALLEGAGNASVQADTVTLSVTGLNPNASPAVLLFQGTSASGGTPFGDGLLCADGAIARLRAVLASNGGASFGFGQAGEPLVSDAGNLPPTGGTRVYQAWYRNNDPAFCTPARFDVSNAVEVEWGP